MNTIEQKDAALRGALEIIKQMHHAQNEMARIAYPFAEPFPYPPVEPIIEALNSQ